MPQLPNWKSFTEWPTVQRPNTRGPIRKSVPYSSFKPPKRPILSRVTSRDSKNFRKTPVNREEEQLMIFKEVFVAPKKEKLDTLKKQLLENREKVLNSNPRLRELIPKDQKEDHEQKENEPQKFEGFYSHQLQAEGPVGSNASSAAVLTPGTGWAPSIPASKKTSSIKDIRLRSKSGLAAGNLLKEAHLNYTEGKLHQEEGAFNKAHKNFLQFEKCAAALNDPFGVSIAINRLGIINYRLGNFKESLEHHMKHLESVPKDQAFVPYYNIGVVMRELGCLNESLDYFKKAAESAKSGNKKFYKCLAKGQEGIAYSMLGSFESAYSCLNVTSN